MKTVTVIRLACRAVEEEEEEVLSEGRALAAAAAASATAAALAWSRKSVRNLMWNGTAAAASSAAIGVLSGPRGPVSLLPETSAWPDSGGLVSLVAMVVVAMAM